MLFMLHLFACDTINAQLKTPEEQLIDLRFEQKSALDTLYSEYGGGTLAQSVNNSTNEAAQEANESTNKLLKALKNTVTSTDRASFDSNCLALGQGKNLPLITDKAKEFFEKPETLSVCKASALRHLEIQKLELQVQTSDIQ